MKLFDLHQDLLLHIEHPEYFSGVPQTSFDLLEVADVQTLFATAFPVPVDKNWHNPQLLSLIERDFEEYARIIAQRPNWHLIKSGHDMDVPGYGVILHVEGLNAFMGTKHDWAMLERWYALGWRSLGIVWNVTNSLGGGTEDVLHPLTSLGEEVIEWCLERKMVIDCAHMNRETFADVATLLKKRQLPILVSHGNADSVCSSERNFTDEQLRTIQKSGGVIGVFFSGSYVAHEPAENTLEKVVKHIEYIRQVAGIDCVALGTDFGGITKGVPKGLETIVDTQKILQYLKEQRQWTEVELEQLAYKNAQRVVKQYVL